MTVLAKSALCTAHWLTLWLVPVLALASDLWEEDWVEIKTPHFAFMSALSKSRTEELAVDLENFVHAAALVTNIDKFAARVPTVVVALPSREEEFGFERNLAGYFSPRMRENFAVITPQGNYSDEVLKHEYTHFLVRNRASQQYPTWFDEGFAQLLSTLSVKGNRVEIGRVPQSAAYPIAAYGWMKFRKVIAARDTFSFSESEGAQFYSQSWFLVHYLMYGPSSGDFSTRATKYLKLVESGVDSLDAFPQAFGESVEDLDKSVKKYIGRSEYARLTLDRPFELGELAAHRAEPAAVAALLAHLALSIGNRDVALNYAEAALKLDPRQTQAMVDRADLHKFAKEYDLAKPLYERAIELRPEIANHKLDYAEFFISLAQEGSSTEDRHANLVEARKWLARSYQQDSENPETLAMNGQTFLMEGEAEKAVQFLEMANELLPSETNVRVMLAQAYIANKDYQKAQAELHRVLPWVPASVADGVQKLVDSIKSEADDAKPASEKPQGEADRSPSQ